MSFNVGLNIVETDGKATPSIQAAPVSNAGFSIVSERGITGTVIRVTSWGQFVERFGAYTSDGYGAYTIRGFFDNGGSRAFVTRVASSAVAAATATLNDASETPTPVLAITAAYRNVEDPGEWGNKIKISIQENKGDSELFDLAVEYKGNIVEVWDGLTMVSEERRYVENLINNELSGSQYIMVSVLNDATSNPSETDEEQPVLLGGGDNGDNEGVPNKQDFIDSIDLFELEDVQLLCCPETTEQDVVTYGLAHSAALGDRMFLGHTPEETNEFTSIKGYTTTFRKDKVYGAMYFPWIQVSDPLGVRKWIPPTGHILGVYDRIARARGPWKAPAGNSAGLKGALDVKFHITDTDHTDIVKSANVNAVRFISGQGIIIDSSRTLSTNPLWFYVNVRQLFNFVKSSLKNSLRWVVQEPNDETLWNKVKYNSVIPFLMGLWRQGAFGPGTPEQVFEVQIDGDNNRPIDIGQGIFTAEIYFYPSHPAETFVLKVGQQEGGANASES